MASFSDNGVLMKEQLKTGTTTVAIVCKDGIVLAGDRRGTAGYIASKKMLKVIPINDRIAITTAGAVSDIQLLSKLMKAEVKLKDIQTGRNTTVLEAANLLGGMVYQNIRKMVPFLSVVGFIVGGMDENGFHCYEIGMDGPVLLIDDYTSDGSGLVFALGVLETLYSKGISTEEGVKLAVKAVNAGMQRDPNTGNGIDVLTITADGAKFVLQKQLNTKLEV